MGFFKVLGTVIDITGVILGAGLKAASTQISSQARQNKNLTDEQREAMKDFVKTASTASSTLREEFSNIGNSIKEYDTQNDDV